MVAAIPCSSSVAEKYADELEDIAKYVGNSDASWNFTGNHSNWRGVRAAFCPNNQDLLFGDRTPEEAAANIDAACNAAIDAGYAEEMQDMLLRGEIDVVTSARKTRERPDNVSRADRVPGYIAEIPSL